MKRRRSTTERPVDEVGAGNQFEHGGQVYTVATPAEQKKHPALSLAQQRPGGLILAYHEGRERVPVSFVPGSVVRVEV